MARRKSAATAYGSERGAAVRATLYYRPVSTDESLGLAAVSRGLITPSQLMEANTERVRTGHAPVTLEKILLDKGWLTPTQIAGLTGRCPLCGDMVSRSPGDTLVHTCSVSTTDPTLTPGTAGSGSRATALSDSYADTPRAAGLGPFAMRYEILMELGAGGMGRVYKAKDRKLDRVVALKKFTGDGQSPEAIDRFTREARTAARLSHPNIVQVHDIDVFQGTWYLTMDFILGRSLLQVIEKKVYDRRRLVEMVQQSAEAIHYAHAHQVVHRDIKPSNILIDEDGRPHVADFGLAKEVTQTGSTTNPITVSGALLGTPHYMSPEQAAGHIENVKEISDVYSLGATLYHVLTGKTPIRSTALVDVLNEVINVEPTSPSAVDPTVPRDLDTITMKAMSKLPAQRYATARDFADDVGRFLRGEAILARAPSLGERVARRIRKNKLVTAIVLVALIALAIVAGYGVQQYRLRVADDARRLNEDERRRAEKERRGQALPIVQRAVDNLAQIEREIAFAEGSTALSRSKLDSVLKDADKALELDPDSAHARLVRGRACALLARFDDALVEFGKAIEANPGLVQARFARAHLYLELHFMPVSIPKLAYLDYLKMSSAFPKPADSEFLSKAKVDLDALKTMPGVEQDKLDFLAGFEAFIENDFAHAREKMLAYVKVAPTDAQGHFVAGLAAFFMEQWKASVESFDQVVKLTPSYIPARLCRALAYNIQYAFAKSLPDLNAIRKMDLDALGPNYPMKREKLVSLTYLAEGLSRYVTATFTPLADAAQRQAGWESILKLIDQAVELDPDNYLAYYFRTRTLSQLGRWDDAIAAADAGLRLHDGFANLHQARGVAFYNRAIKNKRDPKDLDQAETASTRAIQCYPQYASAYTMRAAQRSLAGRPDEAAADALEAVKIAPTGIDTDNACQVLRNVADKITDPAGFRRLLVEQGPAFEKGKRLYIYKSVEGILLSRVGDHEGAFKALLAAVTDRPRDEISCTALVDATRNYAPKNEAEALAAADGAKPDVARFVLLGVIRSRHDRKNYAGAEQLATRAIELDESFVDAYLWRGNARNRQQKWKDAYADYQKALELKPTLKKQIEPALEELRKKMEE